MTFQESVAEETAYRLFRPQFLRLHPLDALVMLSALRGPDDVMASVVDENQASWNAKDYFSAPLRVWMLTEWGYRAGGYWPTWEKVPALTIARARRRIARLSDSTTAAQIGAHYSDHLIRAYGIVLHVMERPIY